MKFAYLFRADIENPGDLYSSPMHYLGKGRDGIIVDVFTENIPEMSVDAVIIGGGALFTNKKFVRNINRILDNIHAKHKIVWGVGYDTDFVDKEIKNCFDLFSSREHKIDFDIDWVPCASVLHPMFDELENTTPTKDFLVVDHFKRSIDFDRPHTRILNRPNDIRTILNQIADHRFIITSSYHVAYWSILLGKKCAVIGKDLPSKFRRMKHFPAIAKEWNDSIIDIAKVWPDARYESILANHSFHRKLENLLNIENPAQLSWHLNLKRNIQ